MRESKDQKTLEHEWEIPEGAIDGLNEMIKEEESGLERGQMNRGGSGLYAVKPLPMVNSMNFFYLDISLAGNFSCFFLVMNVG